RGVLGTRLDVVLPHRLLQGAKGNAAGVVDQGAIVEHDDLFQPTRPRELVLLYRRTGDGNACAGVIEAVVQDVGRIAWKDGRDGRSERLRGEFADHHLGGVVSNEGDHVAAVHPQRGEPGRDGAAARVERGPGEVLPAAGGAAVPDRGAGRIREGARCDQLGDGVEGNRRQRRSADLFAEHRRGVYAPVLVEQGGPPRRCLPESIDISAE